MIVVLDTSAAIELVLNRSQKDIVESYLLKADLVTSPDLFIPETTNVFWKYHQFESLQKEICEELINEKIFLFRLYLKQNRITRVVKPNKDALILLAKNNQGVK